MDHLLNSYTGKQWAKIGVKHHHGINLPLFSLHTKNSCGIGEFPDLIPMIVWCKEVGFDIIQLLPLNDTGLESSPYSALSAFALNPLYLGLTQLPYFKVNKELSDQLERIRALTNSQRINYQKLHELRDRFLSDYYCQFKSYLENDPDYLHFVEENFWVKHYAVYKTLKIANQHKAWQEWHLEWINEEIVARDGRFLEEYHDQIQFHMVIQFLCFKQMESVKKCAESHQIFLKGDIPILINRDSADVWWYRQLFDLQYTAGSLPDMYSVEGQVWGFPLFNWNQMRLEDFWWWKLRLQIAEKFYHLYRLDHIIAFFRIYAIPLGKKAKEGFFYPEQARDYLKQGDEILRILTQSNGMLPIGEDLGSVPKDVREELSKMGIAGTRVMRWERYWEGSKEYIPYDRYFPESMTTASTHDSETVRQWLKSNTNEVEEFAKFKHWGYDRTLEERQREILYDSHHTNSLFHINPLQEYLALVPGMTWPNDDDERINTPGTISDRNWSYRFKPSVEEITTSVPLKNVMKTLIE